MNGDWRTAAQQRLHHWCFTSKQWLDFRARTTVPASVNRSFTNISIACNDFISHYILQRYTSSAFKIPKMTSRKMATGRRSYMSKLVRDAENIVSPIERAGFLRDNALYRGHGAWNEDNRTDLMALVVVDDFPVTVCLHQGSFNGNRPNSTLS